MRLTLLTFILIFAFFSCEKFSYYHLATYSHAGNLHAVIEMPAGSAQMIDYNIKKAGFVMDKHDGSDRIIRYLPSPGNIGFVPSTNIDDKDSPIPIDIVVLCREIETATLIETTPLGVMDMHEGSNSTSWIVAIPADTNLQSIRAQTFNDFRQKYNTALGELESWFSNYKGTNTYDSVSWRDEKTALELVEEKRIDINK